MFEKLGRLAEAAASSVGVSRRGFLGRMGRAALGMAGVVAGLLALPTVSPAQGGVLCCKYQCRVGYLCNKVKQGFIMCVTTGSCPTYTVFPGTCRCVYSGSVTKASCTNC